MNHDASDGIWRFTEPSNTEDDIQISKTDKLRLNFPLINIKKSHLQTDIEKNYNSVATEDLTKPICTKMGDNNVILLKDIRLLKVKICMPKTFQRENSPSTSLSKLLLKDEQKTAIAGNNVPSSSHMTEEKSTCLNSKIDKKNDVQCQIEQKFIGPSDRWPSQPKSYRGAARKTVHLPLLCTDTTDGETSGMGSSVDDVFESSTESEAATSSFPPPNTSGYRAFPPPPAKMFQKRRGGWPKGRKRNPNTTITKNSYPKSPTTAYAYFLIERHKLYQNIEPNIPIAFLSKILGVEWKNLTEEDKSGYLALSEADKQRYRNELKSYRLSRMKRGKPACNEKKSIVEESSDCTDEVDDEENGDLFCRPCDQWFTSLHNKREHLYGRFHLQTLKEGQPKLRKSRWKSTPMKSVSFAGTEKSQSVICCKPVNVKSESEDDVSMSTGDERASKSDCQSYRESTTEDEDEIHNQYYYPERVVDCMQSVVSKVYDREQEIEWLKEHLKKAQKHQELLTSSLSSLEERRKELQMKNELFSATKRILTRELRSLWQAPLVVEDAHDAKSLPFVVEFLQGSNLDLEPSEEDNAYLKKQSALGAVEIAKIAAEGNSSHFSSSDTDNFEQENFSDSLLGEDIDFNLFTSDFFLDIQSNLNEPESNAT